MKDHNSDGGEGGSRKAARQEGLAAAAQRAAQPSPEAMQKLLRQGDAIKTTTTGEMTDETEDGEGPAGDLPEYVPTGEDRQIGEVYGDWVHSNDGAHLSGGVA